MLTDHHVDESWPLSAIVTTLIVDKKITPDQQLTWIKDEQLETVCSFVSCWSKKVVKW